MGQNTMSVSWRTMPSACVLSVACLLAALLAGRPGRVPSCMAHQEQYEPTPAGGGEEVGIRIWIRTVFACCLFKSAHLPQFLSAAPGNLMPLPTLPALTSASPHVLLFMPYPADPQLYFPPAPLSPTFPQLTSSQPG